MKSSGESSNKPIVSLCIPTDGATKWVLPVIESIYSQNVNNDLFEVIITDNGTKYDLENALRKYNYPNLYYYKSDYEGFTNQIFSLKQGTGLYRKMLNHRSCILPGKLQEIIDLILRYEDSRPIIYFSDRRIDNVNNVIECENYDELVANLHYWISWSAGIGIWIDDVAKLSELVPNKTFPHITMILDIRTDSKCIIWNEEYQNMLPDVGKGGYNFFNAFAVIFLNIMSDYVKLRKISLSTYCTVKNNLFTFLIENYFLEVMRPSTKHTYDLSNIRQSIAEHYYKKGYFILLYKASIMYFKHGLRKVFKLRKANLQL